MKDSEKPLEFDPHTYVFKGCSKIISDDLLIMQTTFREFIDNGDPWNGIEFQVWKFKSPRMYLGMAWKIGIIDCKLSLESFLELSLDIINHYLSNPYHFSGHGFDVAFMVYYMLFDLGVANQMSLTKLELTALFIGALGHDMGHPGLNNIYQINAKTEISQKYKNQSVLENYSIDLLFDLLDKNPFLDIIFENDAEENNQFRSLVKFIILNTDMVYHFDIVAHLVSLVESQPSNTITETEDSNGGDNLPELSGRYDASISSITSTYLEAICTKDLESRRFLISAILHAADISNPARPFTVTKRWSDLVLEEFFLQGDKEKENNLPVSPCMDRQLTNGADVAIGFTNSIVQPYFDLLSIIFPRMDCFSLLLKNNVTSREDDAGNLRIFDLRNESTSPGRKVSMAAGMLEINSEVISSMSGRIRLIKRSDDYQTPKERN